MKTHGILYVEVEHYLGKGGVIPPLCRNCNFTFVNKSDRLTFVYNLEQGNLLQIYNRPYSGTIFYYDRLRKTSSIII